MAERRGTASSTRARRKVERQGDRSNLRGVSPQRAKRRVDLSGAPLISPTGNFPGFVYNGGPVISTPSVHALFVGDWTSSANQTRATRLQQFVTDLLSSRYMNILSQYGCGTSGTLASSSFIASSDHDLSAADIHGIVQGAITANTVPEPTDQATCYILFLDDSTAVNDTVDGVVMCEASSDNAFGFHDFFTTAAGHVAPFAVIPGLTDACLTNSCADDGSCSLHLGQAREARQTQVASHELSEMFSDPQLNAWFDPANGENGDLCNGQAGNLTVGANTWNVQLMYSKWDDMQSSGATTCIVQADNPLPSLLPAVTVVLDRSTFGKDEVDALLHLSNPASVSAAFYVVVDGFTPSDLGITAASLSGTPNVVPQLSISVPTPGIAFNPTALVAEDPSLGGGLQRFTWVYEVDFTSSAAFPVNVGDIDPVTLTATATRTGGGVSASGHALLQLIHEPNPYELDGATSWLSTDLRVFQVQQSGQLFGATVGSGPTAGNDFITDVLGRLQSGNTGGMSFDSLSTDEDVSHLELSETVAGVPVYNFALLKVRYRALAGDATDVRAFFRLFPVSTTSTDYHQDTSYRRTGPSDPVVPLLGIQSGEVSSIPCFAAPRVASDTQSVTTQTDPSNVQTLTHDPSGNEVTAFFGCWLDINQTTPQFPLNPSPLDGPWPSGRLTVQQLMRGHQCLVAEIAFDPDPVPVGASPGGSDKLAQRNLALVRSDNPGDAASHLIPATFEVRPTALRPAGAFPDELLLDWRDLPQGSTATLFLPGFGASTIVELAHELYGSHGLTVVDQDTLGVQVGGLSYLPLPAMSGPNVPGLLSVQLPATVRKGQHFSVVVRQLTDASGAPPVIIGSPVQGGATQKSDDGLFHWRRVLGSYQVSIPVATKTAILGPEERLLSVLRWIDLSIPDHNRWHPVFGRYVDVIADRVRAMGGDPDTIKPSPRGDGKDVHGGHVPHLPTCLRGKVCEVVFDCFGDLEGFVLEDCGHRHAVAAREARVGDLAVLAMRHRLRVVISLAPPGRRTGEPCECGHDHGRVLRIALEK